MMSLIDCLKMFPRMTSILGNGQSFRGLVNLAIAWFFTEKPYMDRMVTNLNKDGGEFCPLGGLARMLK